MSDVLLKQAKTSFEIAYAVEHQIPDIGNWKTVWVRLEVAEQQIQKLIEQRNIESQYAEKMKVKNEVLEGRLNQAQQYIKKVCDSCQETGEGICDGCELKELLGVLSGHDKKAMP